MLLNALSYGVIIPLLYPYAARFGIHATGLSLLFASFSLAQFIATPILGRLSDRYGRKPVLVVSLFGSAVSLALFGAAQSATMLFIARIIDGFTGGNNSVAQAVIADSTSGKERAQALGMLGASFGFGFLIGPAIGGFLGSYGLSTPFWFAAALASVATLATALFLPETHTVRSSKKQPLFDWHKLLTATTTPLVGNLFILSLISSIAHGMFVIGFQSGTVDILHLSSFTIGMLFAVFGLVTVLMQAVGVRLLLAAVKNKQLILQVSLVLSSLFVGMLGFGMTFNTLLVACILYSVSFAPATVVATAILSERTLAEDQGGVLGINQSYAAIGQIIGPLIAGVLVSRSIGDVFFGVAVFFMIGLFFAIRMANEHSHAKADI